VWTLFRDVSGNDEVSGEVQCGTSSFRYSLFAHPTRPLGLLTAWTSGLATWRHWLYQLVYPARPASATVVSAEPFSHGTGTLRCLQKMATYRHWSVSLWRDPDDVPHCRILSHDKTEWWLISATLCGWRRCFVVDQLWLTTRIREEEEVDPSKCVGFSMQARLPSYHVSLGPTNLQKLLSHTVSSLILTEAQSWLHLITAVFKSHHWSQVNELIENVWCAIW